MYPQPYTYPICTQYISHVPLTLYISHIYPIYTLDPIFIGLSVYDIGLGSNRICIMVNGDGEIHGPIFSSLAMPCQLGMLLGNWLYDFISLLSKSRPPLLKPLRVRIEAW